MFGYTKPGLFPDLESIREAIDSVNTAELQNWMQQLPETVVEKEPADVLVLVFVIERLREVREC
jgi:hypothetical protein